MKPSEDQKAIGYNDLNEIARRLRALARRYEDFFKLQFERLEKHMRYQQNLISQADVVRRMMDDLATEKQNWEVQQNAELERISQASDKLVQAWTELENQQRQLLVQSQASGTTSPGVATTHSVSPPAAVGGYATPEISQHPLGFNPVGPPNPISQPQPNAVPASNLAQANTPNLVPDRGSPVAGMPPQATGFEPGSVMVSSVHAPLGTELAPRHEIASGQTSAGGSLLPPTITKTDTRADSDAAQFEYEQLKRQMRQHAQRQG